MATLTTLAAETEVLRGDEIGYDRSTVVPRQNSNLVLNQSDEGISNFGEAQLVPRQNAVGL